MRRFVSLALTLTLTLFLTACESAEERAESYYQSALALIDEGDYDRALLELRNVFQLDPNHLEARHAIADLLLVQRKDTQGAYGQYLRLAEQYPDDLTARVRLAEIAFTAANWEELERHGGKAIELAPDDTSVKIIAAAMEYRTAVTDDDPSQRRKIAANASDLLQDDPDNVILREIMIDNHLRESEFREGLAVLDQMTREFPENQRYWNQRLQVLIQLEDDAGVEAQLVEMVSRFPDDTTQKATLVRYYLSRGQLDDAESFLRDQAAAAEADDTGPRVDLIRFLTELRSVDAARAEINAAIAEEEDVIPYVVLGAALDYSGGEPERAITALEELIEGAEPSDTIHNVRVTLAQMLLGTGNEVGARAAVEQVLLDSPTNAEALKMNARWLINADDTDAAIAGLRTALDQSPEDTGALMLMAEAYSRTGSNDLARDFMSLAVEASGNAPAETVRYVRVLISEQIYLPAEDVLLAALRVAPSNLSLLGVAGELYLAMDDLGRTEQVVQTLNRLETPEALQMAIQLEAERLNRSSGGDEALDYLEGIAGAADASMTSQFLLLRARLSAGDTDRALEMAEEFLAEDPQNPVIRTVAAKTAAVAGDLERALELYEGLLEEFPQEASIWIEAAQLRVRQGDPDAARALIAEAIKANPDSPQILWASASYKERDGDIEGAIEIYENLYAFDSNVYVVANNLASLLATYRVDDESLDRSWAIARRFRDAEIPELQDTYGWIQHRRGNSVDALKYLTGAAAALGKDPIVQFHLAEVLYALDRKEQALDQYRVVIDLAGLTDTRDQIATARTQIKVIEDELAAIAK